MQILLTTVLVNALHAALEDGKEAFDRVRADAATALLANAVVHDAMTKVVLLELAGVNLGFVRQDLGFASNVRLDDRKDILASLAVDDERMRLAALAMSER